MTQLVVEPPPLLILKFVILLQLLRPRHRPQVLDVILLPRPQLLAPALLRQLVAFLVQQQRPNPALCVSW